MLDAFRELIDELLSAPAELRGLNASATDNAEALDAIALLNERDWLLVHGLTDAIRTNAPVLKTPPDQPSSESRAGTAPEILGRFDSGRGEVISLLMNLTLKDWERPAIDWHGEQVQVADVVETHVEFDEETRARLKTLLSA